LSLGGKKLELTTINYVTGINSESSYPTVSFISSLSPRYMALTWGSVTIKDVDGNTLATLSIPTGLTSYAGYASGSAYFLAGYETGGLSYSSASKNIISYS